MEQLEVDALSCSQSLLTSMGGSDDDSQDILSERFSVSLGPHYAPVDHLGAGAYGAVVSAECLSDASGNPPGSQVAVKILSGAFKENTLLARRALREVSLLRRLSHDNVIFICDFFRLDTRWFLVTPLMATDLGQVIESPQPLRHAHVVFLGYQMLRGLDYLHGCGVVHRDLKPANVLVNEDCHVRLADLGMARLAREGEGSAHDPQMTEYVVSRWWRAPEVIMANSYRFSLDIWSFGCIFGEMFKRKPLFSGRDFADQLVRIVALVGKPSPEFIATRIREAGAREFVEALPNSEPVDWSAQLPGLTRESVRVINASLVFDAEARLTAAQLLALPVFDKLTESEPNPTLPEERPKRIELEWKESDINGVADVEKLLDLELEEATKLREERLKKK